ncbi:leucine-rich repeat protein [Peptoniphilus harei]|uniref:leucine-rich repeat protein n=1 Tax=Peptoniphilus harei TaxID=54005 RepID=UPI00290A46AC|nr:leucine-rich repeat protein [Peptoniphilus harei]MDU5417291.1 leucine-rich repeat protein [Peptoniphilus harei]
MQKIKKCITISMIFLMTLTSISTYASVGNINSDDISNHWAKKQITWTYDKNYLSGYPDGTFKPQENMTNAEFISLVIRILSNDTKFDVNKANEKMWYNKFLNKAEELGIISSAANIDPNAKITRDEAFRLLAFAYSVKGNIATLDEFTDKDLVKNKEAVAGLLEKKVVTGYPDKTLRPNNLITRAEVSNLVYIGEEVARLSKIDINKPVEKTKITKSTKTYYANSIFDNFSKNTKNINEFHKKEDINSKLNNSNNKEQDIESNKQSSNTIHKNIDEKSELLKKLQTLINEEVNIKNSSTYEHSDSRTSYDFAITRAKEITENTSIEQIKGTIRLIETLKENMLQEYPWEDSSVLFEFDKKTQTIRHYNKQNNKYKDKIVVPYEIDGVIVKNIGKDVFKGHTGIKSIDVYDNIKDLTKTSSKNIEITLYLPNTIEYIGGFNFENCGIEKITFPKSLEELGPFAFTNNKLGKVIIPDSVKRIDNGCFLQGGITDLYLNDKLEYIGSFAFSNNNFKEADLPDCVNFIGSYAFLSSGLKKTNIPNSLTAIQDSAFAGNKLTTILIPDSVERIGSNSFENNQIESLIIPNSVSEVGRNAFSENKITKLVLPNRPIIYGDYAFYDNHVDSIEVTGYIEEITKDINEITKFFGRKVKIINGNKKTNQN